MSTKTKVRPKPIRTTKPKLISMRDVSAAQGTYRVLATNRGGGELQLRRRLGFSRPQFARLVVPVSERSLADIEKGKAASEAVNRSLAQLQRLIKALEEVIEPSAIGPWLTSPNPAFDGLKPFEVIDRGEIDRIWQMIYQLRSGVPS